MAGTIGIDGMQASTPGSMFSSGFQRSHRLLVTLLALIVYWLIPTKLYFWDGINFSINIEAPNAAAVSLFHPNHLVYNLIGFAVWKGLAALGFDFRVLPVLQVMNALIAAATVYLFWNVLKEKTQSAACASWATLTFAFSATWWKYASDADAYILSIFFLVLSYHFASMQRARPFAAGLAHGAAILVHQLAIFFLPVALLGVHDRSGRRETGRRQRIYATTAYVLTTVSLTAFAYGAAFLLQSGSAAELRGFWKWITTHQDDVPFFSFALSRNAQLTIRSIVRLFLGGRFSFARADLATFTVVLVSCLAAGLLLHNIRRSPESAALDDRSHRPSWIEINRLPLLWFSSFTIFLFFGRPQDTFHWLFCAPALILLIVGTGSYAKRRLLPALAFLAIFACNFVFYIYPYSRAENNEVLSFAVKHQEDWPPGSVIMYSRFHSDLWTISYFNPQASWVAVPVPTLGELNERRSRAGRNGNPLWLEATAYSAIAGLPLGPEWIEENVDRSGSLIKEKPGYKLAFYRLR
jgi:hypothetical protein